MKLKTENEEAHIYHLTDSERDYIKEHISEIKYDVAGGNHYIMSLRRAMMEALPQYLLLTLTNQKTSLIPEPYIIVKNCPEDEEIFFSPDAEIYTSTAKTGCISENFVMGVASLIGEPYSMQFEGREIVNNLIPKIAQRKEFTGLGYDVELDFHIENAALKHLGEFNISPLGLLLLGIRYDPNGPMTRISDARKALSNLSAKDINLLTNPNYRIKLPFRWREVPALQSTKTNWVPLINGNIDYPELSAVFYPDMIIFRDDSSRQAFLNLYEQIKINSIGLKIKPGELVYIDNRFCLHSRDQFSPGFDAKGTPLRWLQRVFISNNLWNHRNIKNIKDRIFSI